MLVDYHTHHERCGHAKGALEDYVRRGIEIGLTQIGLSDHMPLVHIDPMSYYEGMAMPYEELPRYVEECFRLKQKYQGQIDIRVGLEGDFIEGCEEEVERIVRAYSWDYVIGSVHFLGTWDITDHRQQHEWESREVDEVFRQYYEAVQKAAETRLFDFIGHFDVVKRFGRQPLDDMESVERETLRAIEKNNMAIELNTSGLYMPAAEMFPSRRILENAHKLNIPVTISSDAHQPQHLGRDFGQARALLEQIGYSDIATFSERRRYMLPFEKK